VTLVFRDWFVRWRNVTSRRPNCSCLP